MNMYEIISKKKRKKPLSKNEINWLVNGFNNGEIPDYQMSALLMAICINSMNDEETTYLTLAMANSGEKLDLSSIGEIITDKHSTGGVGDKTTLIIAPIVSACGVYTAKMSGRGLGHTGGTIDKLESIPGFKVQLSFKEFTDIIKSAGFSIVSQTKSLAPADKKIYALRDCTATVDSIPLIASSIMSKKLATSADCLVLDIKTGSGAFMKELDDAMKLGETMVAIAKNAGRKCCGVITDMNSPLGNAVGNSLEVIEAIETLKGNGPKDLLDICIELSAQMISLAKDLEISACREMALNTIKDGSALEVLRKVITLQGGDSSVIDDYSIFPQAEFRYDIISKEEGYISSMDCEKIGIISTKLGAGRITKDTVLDYSAGIVFNKKHGNYVERKDIIATFYTSLKVDISELEEELINAINITDKKPYNNCIIKQILK